jgi:hypothetical protein
LILAAPAAAQTQPSDQLIVYDANHVVKKNITVIDTTEKPRFIGAGVAGNAALWGNFVSFQDVGPNTRISDIVGIYQKVTATGTKYLFGFASDTESVSPSFNGWVKPGVAPPPAITEPTSMIDVSQYLSPKLQAAGWHAFFGSDVEATGAAVAGPSTVPEPASWAMLLLGLGGVGAILRSARRKAAIATA